MTGIRLQASGFRCVCPCDAGEDYAVCVGPLGVAGDCVAPVAQGLPDRTPGSLPAGLVATKPRSSSARITRLEVSQLQQSTSLFVVIVVARQIRPTLLLMPDTCSLKPT